MELTQEQINVQNMPLRKKHIKIELLNIELQVVDTLQGYALNGNITANANNTIRRSGDITLCVPIDKSGTTFLDQINNMKIALGGKIWLDKRVKIYVGTETTLEGQSTIVWDCLGVFLIDKPVRIFNSSQYTISFNVVDQMVLLTGSRQGQITGLGVEIPQFTDVVDWDDGQFVSQEDSLFGVNGTSDISNNEIISETKKYDSNSGTMYIATLAGDKRTVTFYRKNGSGSLIKRNVGLPSQLDNIDLVSINYVTSSNNFIALGSNGYLYIMSDDLSDLSATLTYVKDVEILQIAVPTMVYSTATYYVASDSSNLYFINKNDTTIQTRKHPTIFGSNLKKFRVTSAVLFYLVNNGFDSRIGAINLSTLNEITELPFQSYSDIKDFDLNANTLTLTRRALSTQKSIFTFYTSNNGLSYSALSMNVTPRLNMTHISYLAGPYDTQDYFVVLDTAPSQPTFYLYKVDGDLVQEINSFSTPLTADYFNINFIEFINSFRSLSSTKEPYLILFGAGTQSSIITFFTLGYYVVSNLTNIPQKTYDALSEVLSSLSLIRRFVIHPIEGDFKYLPYDIKVSTSATIWDLIDKFMQILSTWQAYFDINGVFRIEPIPSGETAVVYPLNSAMYITDQNDFDFNNVKNQVVVYGKPNDANYIATNVSLNANRNTLTLTFDNIDHNALGIKTTKFAFETGNMTPDVNINKIVLQSGAQWQRSASSITYSFLTTMQYLDGAWYILSTNLYRSTDGETWDVVYSAGINKIISNGSIYVGLGNQVIYYSEDSGETWAQATITGSLPSQGSFLDVAYGNGQFRATFTRTRQEFATSTDGKNWVISGSLALYSSWDKIEYANGMWVGVTYQAGTDSGIYTYNGSQWSGLSTRDVDYYCLKYLNNQWLAGGSDGIYTSTDNGTTWQRLNTISNIYPNDFAYGNGVYVSVVGNEYSGVYTPFLYSEDGLNWDRSPSTIFDDYVKTVEYNGSAFIASGDNGVYYSADGKNWTQIYNSNLSGVPIANSSNEIKVVDFISSGGTNTYYVYTLVNPSERVQITASFVSFEGLQNYVSSNEFIAKDVYIVRFLQGTLDSSDKLMLTRPITMEYYSRLQPRWCLVDDNLQSPFHINAGLLGENYYAGESVNDTTASYGLRLKNFSGNSLNDGTLITFMANKKNEENPTISVYTEDGSVQLVSDAPLLGPMLYTYGTSTRVRGNFEADKLSNDYSIHQIKYIASDNSFEYLGLSPSVYSLVLSGGEYDNIHADRLAYERCLWELYQHTNLQDNLTLNIVPNYALDVNIKIPYNPADSAPIGTNPDSEIQYFLIKNINYPLGMDSTPQVISAIRIYDNGGLL